MLTYVWDSTWRPETFTVWVEENQRVFTGPYSPSPQVIDLFGDLFNFSMDLPDGTDQEEGAGIQAFLARLRGSLGTFTIPMFHRLQPLGTLRNGGVCAVVNASLAAVSVVNGSSAAVTVRSGDPRVSYAVQARSNLVPITTYPGRTLLAGDFYGLANGQTVMNCTPATAGADGVLWSECTPRVRDDLAPGTTVTWDAPTVTFRLKGSVPVLFRRGRYEGPTIEGIEVPANAL